tara:strand:- start:499 stop:1050 length:552 start_codon:yes stop_codon:yes gene_type:complete
MKKAKKSKKPNVVLDIASRYFFLILISINSLWVFYFVFTPLTIYSVYFLLNLFFDASLIGSIVIVNDTLPIEFIKACIAGSAYYLLLILNLSTRGIDVRKRINMILISFASLLVINIIRIFLLVLVFFYGLSFFDIAHKFFWYFVSTIFVVGIWFVEVKYFKIKKIPFYSDIKFLYKNTKLRK